MNREPSPYFLRRIEPQPEEATADILPYYLAEDSGPTLRDYWWIIGHYRWLIVVCALIALLGAGVHTFTRIPLYTAEATLLIERKPPMILKSQQDTQDATGDYVDEFYKTQYEIIKSRDLASTVIRNNGLGDVIRFAGKPKETDSKNGFVAQIREMALGWYHTVFPRAPKKRSDAAAPPEPRREPTGAYLSMLAVKPVQGTSLVRVAFTTPNP